MPLFGTYLLRAEDILAIAADTCCSEEVKAHLFHVLCEVPGSDLYIWPYSQKVSLSGELP